MARVSFPGLDSSLYEHPFDRKALNALKGTPGLETAVKAFNKYGIEKMLRIQHTGSNIRISDNNLPEVQQILRLACKNLGIFEIPDIYVQWGYDINAFTAGVEKPLIVLNSGAVDLMTADELLFVIGHELGHIKSQHVLYHQMSMVLPFIGELVGSATLGLGDLVAKGIQLALLNWQRMSEFTADRAGLLACQDINVAVCSMMKMAGLPGRYFGRTSVDSFMKQAKDFEGVEYDMLDKTAKLLSIMWQNHPWTVARASEMLKWIESNEYQRIIKTYGKK